MIPHDYHIHTLFSYDSQATMTEMCRAALERGIPEIGFSDHFDMMPEDQCYNFFQADAWWEALQCCRENFQDLLAIRAGVELGEPHRFQDAVHVLLDNYPWDYSLGSLHWVGSMNIFNPLYFEQPEERGYKDYFREMAKMVAETDFDILAHIDIIKRYGFDTYGSYDPHSFEDEIRTILRTCAERGFGLEVNTATLRRPVNQFAPAEVVLRWFCEEGGRWVTLGSDAHLPEHVGFGLVQAMDVIKSVGYSYLACFEARQPRPLPFSQY